MDPYFLLLVASPSLVGTLVGLFHPRHPVRGALVTVLLAAVVALVLCPNTLMVAVVVIWALPLLALTMLGTCCGAWVRRRLGRGGLR